MASFDSYCVAPFKQRFPVQRLFPSDHSVQHGICFGLCLEWMARHKARKGENPKDRIAYIDQDSTILHASIKQRLYISELHHQLDQSSGQLASRNEAMGYAGMQISSSQEEWTNVRDPEQLKESLQTINVATAAAHTYHLITLVFDARGAAHATCCYKSGGKMFGLGAHLYFFEPNFGEFKASTGSVTDLFDGLVQQYRKYPRSDGTVSDLKVEKFVVQTITFKA